MQVTTQHASLLARSPAPATGAQTLDYPVHDDHAVSEPATCRRVLERNLWRSTRRASTEVYEAPGMWRETRCSSYPVSARTARQRDNCQPRGESSLLRRDAMHSPSELGKKWRGERTTSHSIRPESESKARHPQHVTKSRSPPDMQALHCRARLCHRLGYKQQSCSRFSIDERGCLS